MFNTVSPLWAVADAWTITVNIILVILGINALIIVHELGHFIVARLCGVRCEKFYIWFDFWGLKFFKFKWGQTEYGLGLFPLGGYVKMLGQEDNPGELRAEMERAKAEAKTEGERQLWDEQRDSKEIGAQPEEMSPNVVFGDVATPKAQNEAFFAPDSYLAKNVPQRMAIIVAGVVMNFIFAMICATAAYMVGVEETAPAVGSVLPGGPAWKAGLQCGDRIIKINDEPARVFTDINMAMVGGENGVKLTIQRPGVPEPIEKTIIPRKRATDLAPNIGVRSMPTLKLAIPDSPLRSWAKKRVDENFLKELQQKDLKLVAVDGKPVANFAEYEQAQLEKYGQPIDCRFETKDGKTIEGKLPPVPMKEIGVRFRMSPITMILPGSDAEKKGIEPGDTILAVDGQNEVDPLKLPELLLQKVNAGKTSVELKIKPKTGEEKTVAVDLQPIRTIPELAELSMKDSIGSTALGLAWGAEPIIAGVEKDSPAASLGLPVGGKLESMTFLKSETLIGTTSFSRETKDGYKIDSIGEKIDIPYIFNIMLQSARAVEPKGKKSDETVSEKPISVRLVVSDETGATKTFDVPVFDSKDRFNTDRGPMFKSETAMLKVDDFGEAARLGTKKMIDSSLSVFTFLGKLFDGNVSPRALGGPVLIVKAAYMFVEQGLGSYLIFLCLIGANLAVINILPIPVLDGGHLMFLIYEGIFRKPPNENFLVIVSYMGLALIMTLMVWAVSLDLGCIPRI